MNTLVYFILQLSRWWQQTQGEIYCFWVTEYNHRRLRSRSGVASRMSHSRIAFAGFTFFSSCFPPYLMICLDCDKPHTEVILDAARSAKQHLSWIPLLSQTDICWDQPQLAPAARDLKPLLLVRRDPTRSHANNHLLLIPCRHQSSNADPACTLIQSVAPTAESTSTPCWVCLNEITITLELAHVTELRFSLSYPSPILKHRRLLTPALVAVC